MEYGLFDFSTLVVIRLKARGQLIWLLTWKLEERICLKAHWGMFSRFLCWEQLKRVLEVCVDSTLIVICTINPLKNMVRFTHFCVFCVQGLCHTSVHYSQSCVGGAVVGVSLCFFKHQHPMKSLLSSALTFPSVASLAPS